VSGFDDNPYLSSGVGEGAVSTFDYSAYMASGGGSLYVTDYGDGDIGRLVLDDAAGARLLQAASLANSIFDPNLDRNLAHLDQAFREMYGLSLDANEADPEMAYMLDQSLGLYRDSSGYQQGWGGRNEKWLMGSDGWYFILPTGELLKWNGSPGAVGDVVAFAGALAYDDPTLLHEARSTASLADQAYALDRRLGLSLPASGTLQGWGGKNEKWLIGNDGWYFMLPSGELYKWDGSGAASGVLIATLDAAYYAELSLLYDASLTL
jgi:hypothetical protein